MHLSLGRRQDEERQSFLEWGGSSEVLLGEGDPEKNDRVTVPGGFVGARVGGAEDRWFLRYRLVPYLPVRVGSSELEGDEVDGALETGGALAYASDVAGQWRAPLAGRTFSMGFHKDVADRLQVESSMEFMPGWTAGVRVGQARLFGDHRAAFAQTRWGATTLSGVVERDAARQVDGYELRLGRPWGSRLWELGGSLQRYAVDSEGAEALLERQLTCRITENSQRAAMILAVGDDQIAQTRTWFAGVERRLGQTLRLKGGVEFVTGDEDAGLRSSLSGQWVF